MRFKKFMWQLLRRCLRVVTMGTRRISLKLLIPALVLPFFLIPVGLTLVLVLLVSRGIVKCLQLLFRRDLATLMTPMSSLFAARDPYDKPEHVVIGIIYVEGQFNLEDLRSDFDIKLGFRATSRSDQCLYPELGQYPVTFLNYGFWKPDPCFDSRNHFKMLNLPQRLASKNQVLAAGESLLLEPFPRKRSPWDLLVTHDVDESLSKELGSGSKEISVIFLRTHHLLADGLSLSRIYSKFLTNTTFKLEQVIENVKRGQPRPTVLRSPWKLLALPFVATYEILENFSTAGDTNDWHEPNFHQKTELHWEAVPRLSIAKLQRLKSHLQGSSGGKEPSTFGLVLLVLTRALRDAFINRGAPIPDIVHCAAPIPVPGHSDRLDNHFTFCVFSLPVGTENPEEAIAAIENNLEYIKSSTIPWTGVIFPYVLGLCPKFLIRSVFTWYLTTGIITSFPGPKSMANALSYPMLEIGGMLSYRGNFSFVVVSFGYNNHIHMNVGVMQEAAKSEPLTHLSRLITLACEQLLQDCGQELQDH